jgi:hypothetical protein
MTGDGDADLYVRKSAAPTAASYDCRPYRNGTNEECSIVGPATVYVGVNGYAATSELRAQDHLQGRHRRVTPVEPPPAEVVPPRHHRLGGLSGEMKLFTMNVIAGKKVFIRTTAPSDVDLYLQMGAAPTTSGLRRPGLHLVGQRDHHLHADLERQAVHRRPRLRGLELHAQDRQQLSCREVRRRTSPRSRQSRDRASPPGRESAGPPGRGETVGRVERREPDRSARRGVNRIVQRGAAWTGSFSAGAA